ncbi:MAG: type I phosphomannose isomerase catalytic subunit [Lacipirellulaceae bacterium]
MPMLYPLRLKPIFQEYLWGGRRLGSLLGKEIGDGPTYAESWEAVDHPDGQSFVTKGPLAGVTLGELSRQHPEELYGPGIVRERFPLLLKYLDAQKTLSVQVHPNDAQAALQTPPDLGKTEAWVVLAAEPGSLIYAGLKPGTDRAALEAAIADGRCDALLHSFEPMPGDCVFIPAGTVHALGAGLVIAEVQQASNTTFRLFDWNRIDKDGKPRPLHVAQSLAVTDYERGPVSPAQPQAVAAGRERLVACDKFVLDRLRPTADGLPLAGRPGFRLLTVVMGEATVAGPGCDERLTLGQTLLVPASAVEGLVVTGSPGATLLEARLA